MILDGRNRPASLNGDQFLYRPMVRQERLALGAALSTMPEALADSLLRETIADHIVHAPFSVTDMDDDTLTELWSIVFGDAEQELADEKNLAGCVHLEVRYPHLAKTKCESCKAWWWNPLTGELARQEGEPLERPADMELLCESSSCPKGHWKAPLELTPSNRMAYEHFQRCEAAGSFPEDEIVKRDAGIIRAAIRRAESDQRPHGRAEGRGRSAGEQGVGGLSGRADVGGFTRVGAGA